MASPQALSLLVNLHHRFQVSAPLQYGPSYTEISMGVGGLGTHRQELTFGEHIKEGLSRLSNCCRHTSSTLGHAVE